MNTHESPTDEQLAVVEQEAIERATFDDKLEQAVREMQDQDPRLKKLVEELDALREQGQHVTFRMNLKQQRIDIIRFEEVSVPLSEVLVDDEDQAAAGDAA